VINYGTAKTFAITSHIKKVSPYRHKKKITFIFHELCSFTVELRKVQALTHFQGWHGKLGDDDINLQMGVDLSK
jgi:hypothetical protein